MRILRKNKKIKDRIKTGALFFKRGVNVKDIRHTSDRWQELTFEAFKKRPFRSKKLHTHTGKHKKEHKNK